MMLFSRQSRVPTMISAASATEIRNRRAGVVATRRSAVLLVLCVTVITMVGCGGSVVGRWRMMSSSPNRELFALDDVRFHPDGSYAATATIDGCTRRELGRYEFTGWKLYLHPNGGGQRMFESTLKFNRLELVDKERKVSLKKDE